MPSTRVHSSPAGPPPTTSTEPGSGALSNFSGCQPRRYSSIAVEFWVQAMGAPIQKRETQMLQPMHSRMSSGLPSSIFFGRKGSAIEGRAPPIMSHSLFLIASAMSSGLVKRPTWTTGTEATALTALVAQPWLCALKKRDGPESLPQPL